ncbi:hypothetical protein V3O24_14910 [Methylobacter sp. Wu8]|uniref:hypothetical protein n=1 Tax=Methylobacter sp. Wu8 TaxID=3118457 RepID=UPI002F2FF33B
MIDIGTTSFLIKVPSLPREEFERYSTNLFDEWEKRVEKSLILPDYAISLEIEEGSIKGGGRIAVTLGALYFGIGSYADFISGLETIRGQVSFVSDALFESAKSPFGSGSVNAKARKSGGTLSRLHSLFEKVQRGALTADEAMIEATALFGEEGNEVPEFIDELQHQLRNVPRYPEQLSLTGEGWDKSDGDLSRTTKRPPQRPRPKPVPINQQYRIEIWRESKKDKKHVKLVNL